MPTPEPYPYRKLNYPIVNLEQSFTLAEKLQALANLGVPSSVNKAGQVLTVGASTGELEWATVSGGGDVPSSSSADEGKVLTVDSNGEPQWAPPSGGGGGGDVTDVTVNGTSVVTNHVAAVTVPTKTSDLNNDSGFITSSDIPAIPTKTSELQNDSGFITASDIPTIPTKTSELQNDSGFITAAALPTVNNGTLTVQKNGTTLGTFGANSATDKTIDIQVPGKTSDLQNDSGFITTSDLPTVDQTYDATSVNPQSGVAVAQAISGISVDEVPAVTSSDDGKVLTASYSGGHGSYSWETAPSAPTYSEGNMIDISAQGVIGVETTAGITDIQMVNALPANPVATVLYLIPAT